MRQPRGALERLGAWVRRSADSLRAARGSVALLLISLALISAPFARAAAERLPVPQAGVPGFIAGMQQVPDPGLTYKVVFDVTSAGPLDRAHPALQEIARYLNALAEYGVPPIHRHLVVVVHGAATDFMLRDAAFASRHHGHSNPDASLIAAMKQAGVDFRVCGQAVLAKHIQPKQLLPQVQLDLWALSSLVNLQLEGYVRIPG